MSEKYEVRKCHCDPTCTAWKTIDPSGHIALWKSWERAMLRATKEW